MRKFSMMILCLLSFLCVGQVRAAAFSGVVAFGDSLSDSGANPSSVLSLYKLLGNNCDPTHLCPPYYDGRISNGPVAVEYFSNAILPGGANVGNFLNYAIAGSTSGVGNYGDQGTQSTLGYANLPGMAFQVSTYLQQTNGNAVPDVLHFVWGGANDFLTQDSPISAAQNIALYVSQLAVGGADYILVPNIPNLSVTPFVQSLGQVAIDNALTYSLAFNHTLATELTSLASVYSSTQIMQFDTFGFFESVLANPTAYGFSNATDACLNLGAVCLEPNDYVFWDGFHPTTQMHAMMALAVLSQVPIPGAGWLFLSAVFVWFAQYVRRTGWGKSGRGVLSGEFTDIT